MADAKQKTINKFTSIPGIGYARARVLYEHGFRNIKDLKEASLSELSQVPSISLDVAKGIQEYLLGTTFEGDIALEGPELEKELAGLEEDVLDSVIEDFIEGSSEPEEPVVDSGLDITEDLIGALDEMTEGKEPGTLFSEEDELDDKVPLAESIKFDKDMGELSIILEELDEFEEVEGTLEFVGDDITEDLVGSLDEMIDGVPKREEAHAEAPYLDDEVEIATPTDFDIDLDDLDDLNAMFEELTLGPPPEEVLVDISEGLMGDLDEMIETPEAEEADEWDTGAIGGVIGDAGLTVDDEQDDLELEMDSDTVYVDIEDLELPSEPHPDDEEIEISSPIQVDAEEHEDDISLAIDELAEELPHIRKAMDEEKHICPDCGEPTEEAFSKCQSCQELEIEEKGLINRGFIHGAISGRGHVTGMVNGLDRVEGRINGLINGSGKINGIINGVGRISGKVNGLDEGRARLSGKINGVRDFDGYINGLTNGKGRINGLTNGRSQGRVNGMINGQGRVYSSLQPSAPEPGYLPAYRPAVRKRMFFRRLFVFAAFIFLIVSLFGVFFTIEEGDALLDIRIDGDFSDWTDYQLMEFQPGPTPPPYNPNVDITGCRAEDNGGQYLALMLEVDGNIMQGEPVASSALQDTFYVFFDTDRTISTGYTISGLGADNMLIISGWSGGVLSSVLHTFSEEGQPLNFDQFFPGPTIYSGVRGDSLEVQIGWEVLGLSVPGNVDIFFSSRSWDGWEDSGDYIVSNEKSALKVTQTGIAPSTITAQGERLLQLDLEASVGNPSIETITVTFDGTLPVGAIQRCFVVDEGGNTLSETNQITGSSASLSFSTLQITSPRIIYIAADIDIANHGGSTVKAMVDASDGIVVDGGTVTLVTDPTALAYSYIGAAAPSGITIDGGFSDWSGLGADGNNEPGIMGNDDIDVRNYGASYDGSELSIYLDVDGRIFGGASIPHLNSGLANTPTDPTDPTKPIFVDSDRDGISDSNEPGYQFDFDNDGISDASDDDDDDDGEIDYDRQGPDMWLNNSVTGASIYIGPVDEESIPRITGQDFARIYIDADNDTTTGSIIGNIGADRMIQVEGKFNKIMDRASYSWSEQERTWLEDQSGNVDAYADSTRLELGMDVGASGEVGLWFETSDWDGRADEIDNNLIVNSSGQTKGGTRAEKPPPMPFAWDIETVDGSASGDQVGEFCSAVLDSNGYPHVSYYNFTGFTDGALKYAKWTGSAWTIETVDWVDDVGLYTSIALDGSNNPYISYYNMTGGNLKCAKRISGSWSNETIDGTAGDDVGMFTTIAIDSSGDVHISYFNLTGRDLKYAKYDGSSWTIQTLDRMYQVGIYASMVLDSSDYPHISYMNESAGSLKYMKYTGSAWTNETVETSFAGTGFYTSIALDSDDYPHISYIYDNIYLRYAKWTGSAWSTETVDTTAINVLYTSIALDSDDVPHICYSDVVSSELRYATWTGSAWSTETVENSFMMEDSTSIVLDSNDNPHLYFVDDGNGYLRHAEILNAPEFPLPLAPIIGMAIIPMLLWRRRRRLD